MTAKCNTGRELGVVGFTDCRFFCDDSLTDIKRIPLGRRAAEWGGHVKGMGGNGDWR